MHITWQQCASDSGGYRVDRLMKSHHPFLVGAHNPQLTQWLAGESENEKSVAEFGFLMGFASRTMINLANKEWRVSEHIPFGKKVKAYEARRLMRLRSLQRTIVETLP